MRPSVADPPASRRKQEPRDSVLLLAPLAERRRMRGLLNEVEVSEHDYLWRVALEAASA